jgi:hypothetical protein
MNSVLSSLFGLFVGLLLRRVDRLNAFRAKMTAHLIEIQEIAEPELAKCYAEKRIGILIDCAVTRPDIYFWRHKRFDTACAIYHTAKQTDMGREHNAFVHLLYPQEVRLAQDQRTLKEKLIYAVTEISTCAKHLAA